MYNNISKVYHIIPRSAFRIWDRTQISLWSGYAHFKAIREIKRCCTCNMYLHTYMLKDKRHYSGATYHIHICMASFFTEWLYAPMYVAIKCILEASTVVCICSRLCESLWLCVLPIIFALFIFRYTNVCSFD